MLLKDQDEVDMNMEAQDIDSVNFVPDLQNAVSVT